MDEEQERKIVLLLEGEVDDILDNIHNEFKQVESSNLHHDTYRLIMVSKKEEYFETIYAEDSIRGIYYTQSYATEVFPVERKATIVVYE